MQRREFITLLGGATAWPLAARAQQSGLPLIGYLNAGSRDGYWRSAEVFSQSLSTAGYVDGHNIKIEFHWAENQYDRLPAMAADLVQRGVAVIVASTTPSALVAKTASTTIPIVFSIAGDPVKLGLVASLNRPGGNITGTTLLVSELVPKRFELLHEVAPKATLIGCLVNPTNPNTASDTRDVQAAAQSLGRQSLVVNAVTESDFEVPFATLAHRRVGALLVASDPFFNSRRDQLIALSARHAIPTMYSWPEFTAAGGLMSYGNSLAHANRETATYVARILRGENASDLPVQQVTKLELVINLKTAKALGLEVPSTLLARADEVIE